MTIEPDAEVIRKGSCVIDGQKYYISVIRSEYEGKVIHEFVMSLGLVYVNEKKWSKESPDMSGKITHFGTQYKVGLWNRDDRFGNPYTSVGLKFPDEHNQPPQNKNNPPSF